jgi:hypothetical protein
VSFKAPDTIAANVTWTLPSADGTSNQVLSTNGSGTLSWATAGGGGSGDVVGPSSATDNALARFDTTTGKLLQNSTGILTDAGALSGLTSIDATGAVTLTKSSAIILGLASAAAQVSSTGTIAISSDGLGAGADTRSGFMFTGRNTSGTIVNILELSGATGATVTKSLGVGATTPSTSGFGITFPATQSASTDANTLDDYEEGTWTPTATNVTITSVQGTYTKIGRYVYITFYGVWPTNSNGNAVLVQGLPFTSRTLSGGTGGGSISYNGSNTDFYTIVNSNTTNIEFYQKLGAQPTNANFSTKDINFSISYLV